ncbi:MAG: tetratricopeptide repeat protein [Alphaproteobacteria bacterium]|nr:tetratricopeptide repeat protein [Alphaproteobacteria bacterium]
MPLFAGLVLLLDVICLGHAAYKRQPALWFFIIIALPFVGATMYLMTELLPRARANPTARQAAAGLGRAIDPDKEVRAARAAMEELDTAETRRRLADALVVRGRHAEARELYESTLTGAHADDPTLMMGLARALFGLEDYEGVRATLDALREAWPDFQSPEGHMMYARAHEALGDLDKALMEYNALSGYFPGEEARYRHAMLLLRTGREEEAETGFREIVESVESGSHLYRKSEKTWYDLAKQQL